MAEVVGLIAASGQFIEESIKIVKIAKAARDKYRDAQTEIENWQRQFSESDSRRHKTWRAAVSLLKEGEIRSSFSELEQLKSSLNLHIAIKGLNESQKISHTATSLDDLMSLLKSGSGSDEESCLRALFITDSRSDRDGLITIKGHRTPGTFEWIPQTKQFLDWNTSEKGLLWISGAPGKGKTVISIFLSELLEATKRTVIYFFCDNKTASRNSAVNIIRGLMSQLIQLRRELLSCLLPTWKTQQDGLFQSFETLWRIFHHMLDALKGEEVCCVLDALDECDEKSLTSLLRKVTDSYNSPTGMPLKLIIASREEPKGLPQALARYPRITLGHIDEDIRLYISQKVSYLAKIKMIHGSPLHDHIEKAFREGAEGTFLWVSYMAHDLETMSLRQIELALTKLPRGLQEIYERIMSHINVENRDKIADMLMWILFAQRPLEISDICEAIQIEASQTLTKQEVCLDYVRSCGHLLQVVVFDPDSDTFVPYLHSDKTTDTMSELHLRTTFVHQSAKDFLLGTDEERISLPITTRISQAHMRILDRTIAVLESHSRDVKPSAHEWCNRFPLFAYAVDSLIYHISQVGNDIKLLVAKHETFFDNVSKTRDGWAAHKGVPISDSLPLLHFACRYRLYSLAKVCLRRKDVSSLLGHQRKINQQGGIGRKTPLHIAVEQGSTDIIQLLLSCGADVASEDHMRETPLHYALRYPSTAEIYRLLADWNTSRKVYRKDAKHYIKNNDIPYSRSLLHLAAQQGWEDICQELIQQKNYSVELRDCYGDKLIHIALKCGLFDLAKRSVTEWGARLTPQIQLLEALLETIGDVADNAGMWGEAMEIYINHWGCDINTTDVGGCTIFHAKLFDFVALQAVLNTGLSIKSINFDQLNTRNQTFLHSGWYWVQDSRLLKTFLLQSQFDVNTRDYKGCTPLHCAIMYRGEKLLQFTDDDWRDVQLLLDFGADRSLRDDKGRTAADVLIELWDPKPRRGDPALDLLMNYSTVAINVREVELVLDGSDWPSAGKWTAVSTGNVLSGSRGQGKKVKVSA
ncbi:uncharacterized protein FIESC28_02854 [Fusarium coffeatum]|uniref:Nephrocystin 3-like N-terminal domain-containing protein n=1 Tax=Fusarium coffeatum TaxID=231269 RepID=A0A366S4X2_9HYPO|nr:uncharacterized protein FIESC28_02854 [Fusarium coffeatum]RBR24364.1 hypothetical protein FIESC28_02854 [Fusarium coffeatum]